MTRDRTFRLGPLEAVVWRRDEPSGRPSFVYALKWRHSPPGSLGAWRSTDLGTQDTAKKLDAMVIAWLLQQSAAEGC